MKRILTLVLIMLMVCALCACSSAIKVAAPDYGERSGGTSLRDNDEPAAAEPLPEEQASAAPDDVFILSGTGWQCVEALIGGEKQDSDLVAEANIYMEFLSETTVYVAGVNADFEADYVFDASAGVISITDSSGVTQTMTLNENESLSLIDPDMRMELIYVHTYDLDTDDSEPVEPIPFDLADSEWVMTGADMSEGGSSVPDGSLEFYPDGTGMFYYFGHSSEFEYYQYGDRVDFALIGHDKDLGGTLDADTMTMNLSLGDLTNEIHGNLVFSIK